MSQADRSRRWRESKGQPKVAPATDVAALLAVALQTIADQAETIATLTATLSQRDRNATATPSATGPTAPGYASPRARDLGSGSLSHSENNTQKTQDAQSNHELNGETAHPPAGPTMKLKTGAVVPGGVAQHRNATATPLRNASPRDRAAGILDLTEAEETEIWRRRREQTEAAEKLQAEWDAAERDPK